MSFRFFNVENKEEMQINGTKPVVAEMGPYLYREVRRKENILEIDGEHLQYGLYMEYHFDFEKTKGNN